MFGKRYPEVNKFDTNNRIHQLEQLVCPNQSHDWISIDKETRVIDSAITVMTTETMFCTKCKKIKKNTSYM